MPLLYNHIEAILALPETPTYKPSAEPDGLQALEDVTDISHEDVNKEELVESEENRCDKDELVEREIKALYESRWFIGEIKYFNKKLAKYMVSFTDGSEDYIDLEKIENVDTL